MAVLFIELGPYALQVLVIDASFVGNQMIFQPFSISVTERLKFEKKNAFSSLEYPPLVIL